MNNMEDSPPTKKYKMDGDLSDDEDENLTYEERRERNMKRNMEMFDIFGVNEAAQSLVDSIKESPLVKKSTLLKKKNQTNVLAPIRRSLRIAKLPLHNSTSQDLSKLNVSYYNYELRALETTNYKVDDTGSELSELDDVMPMPKDDGPFFDKLTAELGINETDKDIYKIDFSKFTKDIKSLAITQPLHKVVQNRIYSIVIHPSETSLVIAAGDISGNIGFFSKNHSDMRQYRIHNAPVNCMSFCSWDPFKMMSSSHDGTVRYGDLAKQTFDEIYSSKLWAEGNMKNTHCTWHTEYERNLLIANGSGRVDLIDPRTPNVINNSSQCHVRSVRTVQCHPLKKHHFLTASGIGEVSLWDVRYMTIESIKPVLQFEHPKALTSAFFSATGAKMVSTCNDDVIRIFNTSELNADATKPVVNINHNNHTGRWISVFKAKWHPGRDDAFFVGSMSQPRKIQIFFADGSLLHNLESDKMTTYCPVIDVHPTQNIYVGGNASGRLHVFSN